MSIAAKIALLTTAPIPATLILANTYGATGTYGWAGASAGDFAVVYTNNDSNGAMTPPAGWNTLTFTTGSPYTTQVYYKVLTSADIIAGSGAWTGSSGQTVAVLAVYRGPTSLAQRSTASATGTTDLTLTGFIKTLASSGILTVMSNRVAANTPTIPAGFTSRANATGGNFRVGLADITSNSYTNSAAVIWTAFNSGSFEHSGWLIEMF